MKTLLKLLVFILLVPLYAQTDNSILSDLIEEIKIDSLNQHLQELTGVDSVLIEGNWERIRSRYAFENGNVLAEKYLLQKLQSYGYSVSRHSYSTYGKNVLATKYGSKYPDDVYIICAHYDSMPESSVSPGADDNGSGTAAVIEAARVLQDYLSEYTIFFALWDDEELGLIGSKNFVQDAVNEDYYIHGVINLDMIGYNAYGNSSVMITNENSVELVERMALVNQELNIGLNLYYDIQEFPDGSDDMSFYTWGIKAMLLIEPFARSNPNYHKSWDNYDTIDHEYHLMNTKLGIATLAYYAQVSKLTSVEENEIVTDFILKQNYPNPFNPSTKIEYSIAEPEFVRLKVYDTLGREIAELINGYRSAGNYTVDFNADGLANGTYFYILQAGDFLSTKKMMFIK